MKNILLLVVLILVFLIVGCDKQAEEPKPPILPEKPRKQLLELPSEPKCNSEKYVEKAIQKNSEAKCLKSAKNIKGYNKMIKKTHLIIGFMLIIVILSGCSVTETESNVYKQPKTKEGAEATADKFAREWEQEDFSNMYDMFIPEAQQMKTKEDFIALLNYLEKEKTITIRLDKISMESKDVAYAYYTVSSSLYGVKAPATKLEYSKGAWRINAFGPYFAMDLEEKKYFDKMTETTLKMASLATDFNYKLKLHNIETKYGSYYDKTYCPDFKQIYEDAKQLYNEYTSLDIPIKLVSLHSTAEKSYEYSYKSMEEIYNFCIAETLDKKSEHLEDAQKYGELSVSEGEEVQEKLKEISEKYQTEKEKSQNKD